MATTRSSIRVILISDGLPAANGGGISQTLYNLFETFPAKIYFVNRPGEKPVAGPVLQADIIEYRFEAYKQNGKPILNKLNPLINRANFNRQQQIKGLPVDMPKPADAMVLVSTTEPIKLHFAWLLQQRFEYTVIPYFMDDWMGGMELKWKGGNIHDVVGSLLQKAGCRLMISRNLNDTLIKRYGLQKRPTLIVHNPSPPVSKEVEQLKSLQGPGEVVKVDKLTSLQGPGVSEGVEKFKSLRGGEGTHTIIYAGSIWPMHFDALLAVAKAVGVLRQACLPARQAQDDIVRHPANAGQGDSDKCQAEPVEDQTNFQAEFRSCQAELVEAPHYKLLIYTSEASWQHNRKALEGPGVEYGGFIPYAEMPTKLQEGWLLLVTASFDERYAPFTNSSVQTKLTDYIAAGKPVLYVGPEQGASGQFVHEWDCGFSIGTRNPVDIAAQLEAIAAMPAQYSRKAANGLEAAGSYFRKEAVQERLYHFLEENIQ